MTAPPATVRLAFDITARLRVLAFPFALLILSEEQHLGWFACDAPAILRHPHVAIDLDFVLSALLVFAKSGFEAHGIVLLCALECAAEIRIELRAVILEKYELLIEARGI
jgi:hypothetical protein